MDASNFEFNEDYEGMREKIVTATVAYLKDSPNLKSLVLGVSGGVDSALIAALARQVCDITGVKLIGRSIPIESNKKEEIERAQAVGEAFCDDFKEINLTKAYNKLITNGFELQHDNPNMTKTSGKIAMGNIKARLRMMQLYHLAGINKGMVLSTDNFTELMLGFWTLHGDVGDYGMIQNLWKTEVYGLTKHLMCGCFSSYNHDATTCCSMCEASAALKMCCEAIPTDGLGISNSDLDQLGASSYNEVDVILKSEMFEGETWKHPVVERMYNSQFKRDNPYNIPRNEIV